MGFFDKIKGLFYDEEEIDVPVEPIKEEISIKSGNIAVMDNLQHNEKKLIDQQLEFNEIKKVEEINNIVSERDLVNTTQNFKFPIIFEDEDIAKIEKKEVVEEKENNNKKDDNINKFKTENRYQKPVLDRKVIDEVVKKPKKFQPTPIISPIYGILDKNYDNISNKKDSNKLFKEKDMELNFDTIRQKAYGTLTDDIEKELFKSEEKIDEIENKIDNILEENNLLSDLEENKFNNFDDNLYSYEDFGVEYKIDDSNLDSEKIENESKIRKNKEIELTEDLFNLIDSMYDK